MAHALLVGPLRDVTGWRERELAATSLAELRRVLGAEDPALAHELTSPTSQ